MSDLELAKYNMIEQQIRTCNVIEPVVLEALNSLNRHEFVPEQYQDLAYADCQIPFTESQTMMKPLTEAKILQSLNIKSDDTCLEIGTGTGYFTACLASLGLTVHSVDVNEDIQLLAKERLTKDFTNISFESSDAFATVNEHKRYDVIAATASVKEIPESFKKALSINGRLIIVVGVKPAMEVMLVTRTDVNTWTSEVLFETDINSFN